LQAVVSERTARRGKYSVLVQFLAGMTAGT
jgi:hypothetical protein